MLNNLNYNIINNGEKMNELVYEKYKNLANFYNLSKTDTKKLWGIIKDICEHKEFIKRCKNPYYHHDLTTIGEHILSDTIVSYKLANRYKEKYKNFHRIDIKTTIYISMFHDLYEKPWQNTFIKKKMCDKHGFVHPLEAITNAITWYPKYFENKEKAMIIIDGVIHHMYPLMVRSIDKTINLNNQSKYDKLPKKYKDMINLSTNIGKIGKYSLRKTFFIEGRIMSKADKIVALRKDITSFRGYISLISGKNKNINE